MSDVRPPSTGWRIALRILQRLPQPALSRLAGRLADVPVPRPLRCAVLGSLARALHMDLDEAEKPLDEYPTFDALFVRRLAAGRRTWPDDARAVTSPVDGRVGEAGRIEDGRLLQAKGRAYTVAELLADDDDARRFRHGTYLTLYLSPRHYHRIHAPVEGRIVALRRVPGALLPVNAAAVATVDRLFPRNERAICTIDGPAGLVAVVAIGAFNVGRITASFLPGPVGGERPITNPRHHTEGALRLDPPVPIARGAELMAFHLGSTVVLLFEPERVTPAPFLQRENEVRLGAVIGSMQKRGAGREDTP